MKYYCPSCGSIYRSSAIQVSVSYTPQCTMPVCPQIRCHYTKLVEIDDSLIDIALTLEQKGYRLSRDLPCLDLDHSYINNITVHFTGMETPPFWPEGFIHMQDDDDCSEAGSGDRFRKQFVLTKEYGYLSRIQKQIVILESMKYLAIWAEALPKKTTDTNIDDDEFLPY